MVTLVQTVQSPGSVKTVFSQFSSVSSGRECVQEEEERGTGRLDCRGRRRRRRWRVIAPQMAISNRWSGNCDHLNTWRFVESLKLLRRVKGTISTGSFQEPSDSSGKLSGYNVPTDVTCSKFKHQRFRFGGRTFDHLKVKIPSFKDSRGIAIQRNRSEHFSAK